MASNTKSKIPPAPKWDLDSIFTGGSKSDDYKKFRENTRLKLENAEKTINSLSEQIEANCLTQWVDFILTFQELYEDIEFILYLRIVPEMKE